MGKVDSHNTPKVWETHKHYRIMCFLHISREAKTPYNLQNMEKVNFSSTGKVWENTSISDFMAFLNVSSEAEIHKIPKVW